MSKRVINIIYICLTFAAISCVSLFFISWNSLTTVKNDLQGYPLEHFAIEACQINNHRIDIAGWSFIPDQDHSITKIYAEVKDGKLLPIFSNFTIRADVMKLFGKGKIYKNSGFQASKRFLFKNKLTHKILIFTQSENNQSYVAQFICK